MLTGGITWLFLLGYGPRELMTPPWDTPTPSAPPWAPNRPPCIYYNIRNLDVRPPAKITGSFPPCPPGFQQQKATWPDQGSIPGLAPGPSTGAVARHFALLTHKMPQKSAYKRDGRVGSASLRSYSRGTRVAPYMNIERGSTWLTPSRIRKMTGASPG